MKPNEQKISNTRRRSNKPSGHTRLVAGLILFAVTSFIMALPATAPMAFDVKKSEEALEARSLALPKLSPNYDQARVDLYLAQASWQIWNQAHGGNWTSQYDTLTGKPRRVYGGAIPWIPGPANSMTGSYSTAELERVARDFIAANQPVIGVSNEQLKFVPQIANPTTDGHMHYAAFDYEINGVPVEAARLVFAVNNGNMIYWSSTGIADVPTVTTPSISPAQAMTALLGYAGVTPGGITVVRPAALKLLPQNTTLGALLTYRLVYEAAFRLNGGLATWAGYVDATTGSVIAFGDVNRYQEARNSSTGRVTGGIRPAQATDPEVVRSFPYVAIDSPGGPRISNFNGIFSYTGGSLSTGLNGKYFDANCVDCIKSEADPAAGWQAMVSSFGSGRLAFGAGGRDVVQSGQSTISYGNGTSTPADRTAFFHTNVARLMAKKWLDLDWLNNSTVPVNVNINDVCNAFWNGTSLNFFKSGASGATFCNNTGEIRDVMQHEWGHGLDSNDGHAPGYSNDLLPGLGDFATGEGVGDHIALFVDHDSCIGQSFARGRNTGLFVTDPDTLDIAVCDGVRDLDELRATRGTVSIQNVEQKCPAPSVSTSAPFNALYFGPLLREGHCEGEIYGQFGWHLVQDLINGTKYGTVQLDSNKQKVTYAGDPLPAGADGSANPAIDRDLAWTTHERIFFQSRPLVGSYAPSRHQAIGPSVYDAYIVTDDEGDGLSNGTPHAAYINDAAIHHGIEEAGLPGGYPAAIDSKNCDILATPSVSLSQAVDASTGTPAVRVSWTPVSGAASYTVLRAERRHDAFLEVMRLSSATSFLDVGVDNGVTYLYRVQANGGGNCYVASPGGVATISISQPDPQVKSVVVTDSPGGNNDGGLDPSERAQLYVTLANPGLVNLTNVTATLSSITQGVTVTKAGPRSYGSIQVNQTAGPNMSFAIAVDSNGGLCGKEADFIISILSDQGAFVDSFGLRIGDDGTNCVVYKDTWAQPTTLSIVSDRLNQTCGDGDLIPDPGETIKVDVTVNNIGSKAANNVVVSLAADRSYFSFVSPSSVTISSLAPQGLEAKTVSFSVAVGRSAPFDDLATFTAGVTASGQPNANQITLATRVNRDKVLKDFNYDFETGAQGWTSSDPVNGWTLANNAVTTGNLTRLWHIADLPKYAPEKCSFLVSPAFEFSSTSELSFDIAWLSENSDGPYDGVDAQVSIDGGKTWLRLDVVGVGMLNKDQGYPAVSAGTTCVPEGNGFFCGYSPLMSRYKVDLSPWKGLVGQIRFRWGSDQLVEIPNGGAWIDNVAATRMAVPAPSRPCL